jgi:hypothetical protein
VYSEIDMSIAKKYSSKEKRKKKEGALNPLPAPRTSIRPIEKKEENFRE